MAGVEVDRRYLRWIEGHLLGVERECSPASFDELVCLMRGAYPTETAAAITRLAKSRALDTAAVARLQRRAPGGEAAASARYQIGLPVPHPLDFDWRFTDASADALLNLGVDVCRPGETIALLGTPSVYAAAGRANAGRRVILWDQNGYSDSRASDVPHSDLSVSRCDIATSPLPSAIASYVVLDPPWYNDKYRSFVWAASCLSKVNATVAMVVPGQGTRPGIHADHASVVRYGATTGLRLEEHREGAIAYIAPRFERNALEAAGLGSLPWSWRRGDLLVFRRTEGSPAPRPAPIAPDRVWAEIEWMATRVRVRARGSASAVPSIVRLVDGDVLDSVSRRDPRRPSVDVWTAGNRVYKCDAGAALSRLLYGLARGVTPVKALALDRDLSEEERGTLEASVGVLVDALDAEASELRSDATRTAAAA